MYEFTDENLKKRIPDHIEIIDKDNNLDHAIGKVALNFMEGNKLEICNIFNRQREIHNLSSDSTVHEVFLHGFRSGLSFLFKGIITGQVTVEVHKHFEAEREDQG